jgi:hypothetical protein
LFGVQLSHVYELLSYGEHGTTVDEVFYSCDVSVLVSGGGSTSKSQSKKSASAKNVQNRANAGNLDSIRQLMNNEKSSSDPTDFTAASTAYSKVCMLLLMCLMLCSIVAVGSRWS